MFAHSIMTTGPVTHMSINFYFIIIFLLQVMQGYEFGFEQHDHITKICKTQFMALGLTYLCIRGRPLLW